MTAEWPAWWRRRGQDESGYALVETVVALAILLSVLVPVGLGLVAFMARPVNERSIVALALARQAMERTLYARLFASTDDLQRADYPALFLLSNPLTNPWRVTRQIDRDGPLVTIRIQVFRRNRPRPVVTLTTMRIDRSEAKPVLP